MIGDAAELVVYGEDLVLDGSHLTGFLDDGSPLDVRVVGNLENLVLIPEPNGQWLAAAALLTLACLTRRGGRRGLRATRC